MTPKQETMRILASTARIRAVREEMESERRKLDAQVISGICDFCDCWNMRLVRAPAQSGWICPNCLLQMCHKCGMDLLPGGCQCGVERVVPTSPLDEYRGVDYDLAKKDGEIWKS